MTKESEVGEEKRKATHLNKYYFFIYIFAVSVDCLLKPEVALWMLVTIPQLLVRCQNAAPLKVTLSDLGLVSED